jgi:hypothetical protein
MKRKNIFLVSQKQAKMKRNKMRFALFRFEAKIKKERKRDTLFKTNQSKVLQLEKYRSQLSEEKPEHFYLM